MLGVALLIAFAVAWLCWLYERYQRLWKHIAKFPGHMALPILGNALEIGWKPEEHFSASCGWCKEFNFQPFRVYGGTQAYVLFPDVKNTETILSSSALTYKSDMYNFLYPWLGEGLLTANGQKWLKHRKMITPSFHFQILQDFLIIMNETTDRFMTLLDTFAENEEIFDFQEIITRSTIEVISECAMGTRLNAIDGKPARMVDAMHEICGVIQERMFSALKRHDFFFRFSKGYHVQAEAIKIMQEDFSKIITERRTYLENKKINQNSEIDQNEMYGKRRKLAFLDNLLTAELDGQPLTFQEIFEEVATFIFEGHDTTASALTFAAYCLSRHPEIQQRAFEEQLSVFGADCKRHPTYQELQDMKYMECVIKETLRIYPSVPFYGRTTASDTEINGNLIPKGVTIVVPTISISTNEKNFEEPFVFRPERFESTARSAANPFEYVPFSAGPRNCIGQKFAMMELKVTLSRMLRHFHILPPVDGLSKGIYDHGDPTANPQGPYDPRLAVLVTLKSVNGIPIRLRRRALC